jgi:hypothetical protein
MEFMTDEMKRMDAKEAPSHPRTESEWLEIINKLNEELEAEREENEGYRSALNNCQAREAELKVQVKWLAAQVDYYAAKINFAEAVLGHPIDDWLSKKAR